MYIHRVLLFSVLQGSVMREGKLVREIQNLTDENLELSSKVRKNKSLSCFV